MICHLCCYLTFQKFLFPVWIYCCHCFYFEVYSITIHVLIYFSCGLKGVIIPDCDFGIEVTGEPLSMMILICWFLTNAVKVKSSGLLLFIERVEWILCFIEWIVSGDQSSSFALLASGSCTQFTLLFGQQLFGKWPIFWHFAHFFPEAGHSCCHDQFRAPQLLSSFLSFATLSTGSLMVLVLFC